MVRSTMGERLEQLEPCAGRFALRSAIPWNPAPRNSKKPSRVGWMGLLYSVCTLPGYDVFADAKRRSQQQPQ